MNLMTSRIFPAGLPLWVLRGQAAASAGELRLCARLPKNSRTEPSQPHQKRSVARHPPQRRLHIIKALGIGVLEADEGPPDQLGPGHACRAQATGVCIRGGSGGVTPHIPCGTASVQQRRLDPRERAQACISSARPRKADLRGRPPLADAAPTTAPRPAGAAARSTSLSFQRCSWS